MNWMLNDAATQDFQHALDQIPGLGQKHTGINLIDIVGMPLKRTVEKQPEAPMELLPITSQFKTGVALPDVLSQGFAQLSPFPNPRGANVEDSPGSLRGRTLDDDLNATVLKTLPEKDRAAFKSETNAYRIWYEDLLIHPNRPMPDMKIHTDVARRAQEIEKQIGEKVDASMSPADKQLVGGELKFYNYRMSKYYPNCVIDEESMKNHPKMGAALTDYFRRIQEETRKMISH